MNIFNKASRELETLQDLLKKGYTSRSFGFIGLNNGAGNSGIAASFASAISKGGQRTVLIDGNLFQPNSFFFFNKMKLDRDKSITKYADGKIELKELNQKVSGHENLWLISTHPEEWPGRIMAVDEEKYTRIIEYCIETFDYVIVDLPYLPSSVSFLPTVAKLDKGIMVWNEDADCGYKGAQVYNFINNHSNRGSSMNNVIINKRNTSIKYDSSKLASEFKLNLVAEVPFIERIQDAKSNGQLLIDSPHKNKEFDNEFKKIFNFLLKTKGASEEVEVSVKAGVLQEGVASQ